MSTGEASAPKWQTMIWLGLGATLCVLLAALLSLVAITQMRILTVIEKVDTDLVFTATTLGHANLILLRLVVVLIGGGISFAGLAVSFFAHEKASEVSGAAAAASQLPRVKLISHSPGVIAIVVGAALMACSLFVSSSIYYSGSTGSVFMPHITIPD
ncbi:hypothetical protein [Achromobacter sp. ACRQX]|uniref:hypothetical protein n=1 Tax=Achromobacter sp. ACRQX TaxID=2918181 RepID=UPI001EF3360B|nr:hypothetical protein [Achromobacter sp. ACRQX]MCG7326850.1 hypothetical protein [Achromobacter sp. ACRQX]